MNLQEIRHAIETDLDAETRRALLKRLIIDEFSRPGSLAADREILLENGGTCCWVVNDERYRQMRDAWEQRLADAVPSPPADATQRREELDKLNTALDGLMAKS